MKKVIIISGKDFDFIQDEKIIIIAEIRKSRIKSKDLAILEILSVFEKNSIQYILNGPMSDISGRISFLIDNDDETYIDLFKHIGYCHKYWKCVFLNKSSESNSYTWKKRKFILKEIYCDNVTEFRNQSADKRPFELLHKDGTISVVNGYRGDGSLTGQRALSVEDCRLLSNITCYKETHNFLDPFAGAGGIIYQITQNYPEINVYSIDISPDVSYGLQAYGSIHHIGNAADYVAQCKFDAISTEVPFSDTETLNICQTFINIHQSLNPNCKIAVMCALSQTPFIMEALIQSEYKVAPPIRLNRKGTSVDIIITFNNDSDYTQYIETKNRISNL